MGFSKRITVLFYAVTILLFLGCFLPGENIFGKEQEPYTSVTIELRDADTGEVFHTDVHPWQRAGKSYTYYMEDAVCQEDGGCYWYDETHEGTISEINALSEHAGQNRIVLYYKRYEMRKDQYAVTVTFQDADTDEVIHTEQKLFEPGTINPILCEGHYVYDMDYCITGENGESYLYDIGNEKNVPATKMEKNPVKNQIILYYRKGQLKEGEAVAEIRCNLGRKLMEKTFITGLPVGEAYQYTGGDILQAEWIRQQGACFIREEWCSFDIGELSANPKENTVKLEYILSREIGGLYIPVFFPVRYVDEATGAVLAEEEDYDYEYGMITYRPKEILHLASGDYYFDNTCPDQVLLVDGNDYDLLEEDDSKSYPLRYARKAKGGITLYYRADKKPGDKAGVYVDYLDSATGQVLKTAELRDMEVGRGYSHLPEASFDSAGKRYLFDQNHAGNVLYLEAVCGQPDMDRILLYYTGTSLPEPEEATVKPGRVFLDKPKKPAGHKGKLGWKKVSGADGYQVVYADNKQFKKAVKITTVKNKITLKKLKKGNTYYVKVRAYRLDSAGKKVYGKYSGKKMVKVK